MEVFQKLLLSSLYIVNHREFDARVVDLFQSDDHPKEMRQCSPDFGVVLPFFELLTAIVGVFELVEINFDDLLL